MVKLSDNMRGALFMTGSMTAFTVNDAFIKLLGEDLPLFQILLLRGIGVVIFLGLLTHYMGQLRFDVSRRDWGLITLRSAAEAASVWFFMSALFEMDLANLSAILQALPLTVTLAGALFLGEAVGWRRLAAILIGFLGVLLIIQPGSDGFSIYALYGLGAVVGVTIRDLAARKLSRQTPSLLVSFVAAVFVLIFAGVGATTEDWAPITSRSWGLITGAMVFIIAGYIFSVSAMRVGEIGFVAPFRYTSLVVAMILGVLVFGTFPDGLTLIGAAIVVATGLFTLLREWKLRKVPPKPIPGRHRGL